MRLRMLYLSVCLLVSGREYLRAQFANAASQNSSTIRGEISSDGQTRKDVLSVELVSRGQVVNSANVLPDGTFEFTAVQSGEYEVLLAGPSETILQRQLVSVRGNMAGVSFKLDDRQPERPVDGTVTYNRLLHPVPSAALKEFERGGRAAQKGLTQESIRHLQKSLAIFPDYVEAHNDLGVRYLKQGNYEQAAAEFQAALKIEPRALRPTSNLALAWVALGRYTDAESAARRAVSFSPNFEPAQRVLKLALARVTVTPEPNRVQSTSLRDPKPLRAPYPQQP